ncbi:MAG: MobQ family relaxase [Rhizonema sp. NSF051]|nr:MobQ family relaxase [Rhizonema sp. NSF051]
MEQGYYRLEAKVISRSKGHSATAAAAYRAAEIIRDEYTGQLHDFSSKSGVYLSEIHAPAGSPNWVINRKLLWNAVEGIEWTDNRKKATAQLARDVTICFPAVMAHEHKLEAARSFMKEFTKLGMVGDISYHDFTGKNKHNPHAHILLTLRELEGDRFGKKNRDWNKNELLEEWRSHWCHHQNVVLEKYGYDIRVDHRSYKAQGIDRVPTLHEGREVNALRQKGKQTNKSRRNDEIKQLNQELEAAKEHLRQQQIRDAWREKERAERIAERERLAEELSLDNKVQSHDGEVRHLARIAQQAIAPTIAHNIISPSPSWEMEERKRSDPQPPKTRQYYSWHVAKQQLDAMGGDGRFEIGLLDRQLKLNEETGELQEPKYPMQTRTFTKESILRYDQETGKTPILSWLRHQNTQGKDIFIRLAPTIGGKSQGLIFVDDLDPSAVEDLKGRGLEFAVLMESSPKNFQGFVRVSNQPIERETASQLGKMLAEALGGDKGSAGFNHYGRLSGLTNRKLDHLGVYSGKHGFPYVKLIEATGKSMRNGAQWVEKAKERAEIALQKEHEAAKLVASLDHKPATEAQKAKALQLFEQLSEKARVKNFSRDPSSIDWAALKQLAKRGWGSDALRYALEYGSPDLEKRKPGHVTDYINRTVANIFKNKEVIEAIARRQERAMAKSQQTVKQEADNKQSIPENDQRQTIGQWQEYKERERSKLAATHDKSARQSERGSVPSSDKSQDKNTRKTSFRRTRSRDSYKLNAEQITKTGPANNNTNIVVEAVGELDAHTVAAIIQQAQNSTKSAEQIRKAQWALGQDTTKWRSQAKAEYLRELGRMVSAHGKEAVLNPSTDAQIAVKMRIAGYSYNQIYSTIREQSPVSVSLPDTEYQIAYLTKGIKPLVQTSQVRTAASNLRFQRQQETAQPEHRLDKLGLATPTEATPSPPPKQQTQARSYPQNQQEPRRSAEGDRERG